MFLSSCACTLVTIANSAAIMEMPDTYHDMVRPGIILYGIYPSREVDRKQLKIRPVMSFKTRIVHVKTVKEADRMLLKERKEMNDRDRSEKIADSEKQRGVDKHAE